MLMYMNNQELYHKYLSWASQKYENRESQSLWRWIEDFLNTFSPSSKLAELEQVIQRLEEGEPIQYILERAYFFDMELKVNSDVLIPRPETEELVFYTHQELKSREGKLKILDIGTGSGCVALAIQRLSDQYEVWACDIDEKAVKVAEENASKYSSPLNLFIGDFTKDEDFNHLPPFDAILSNPPYILPEEKKWMSASTAYEPDIALYSKDGPLWAYQKVSKLGQKLLNPGGLLAMEMNEFYANEILDMTNKLGYVRLKIIDDLQGKPRVLIGQRPH